MTEASTPAPWHYGRTQGRTGIYHSHSARCACKHDGKPLNAGVRLIFVHDERRPVTGQDVADMKLAKAAPLLANLLNEAREWVDIAGLSDSSANALIEKIDAALKATN